MQTPRTRARWMRGVLVGTSSAVVTACAHAAAGGSLPRGGALVITALLCATIGTLFGSVQLAGRTTPWLSTTAALCAAQLIGHVALALAGGHHHSGSGLLPGPTMAAFHIGAAIVLGTAIAAVEYLYVVCASVLCWLRLFSLRGARPAARAVRCSTKIVVVQPVLVTGLGMRAPPRRPATA